MEISKDKVNIQRRNDRLHFDEFEASYDRKLKTANKARNNRQLFLEGLAWCHDGNNLNDAVTEKKENISFKRGYEEGLYQIGFRYGYDYIPYDNIPEFPNAVIINICCTRKFKENCSFILFIATCSVIVKPKYIFIIKYGRVSG